MRHEPHEHDNLALPFIRELLAKGDSVLTRVGLLEVIRKYGRCEEEGTIPGFEGRMGRYIKAQIPDWTSWDCRQSAMIDNLHLDSRITPFSMKDLKGLYLNNWVLSEYSSLGDADLSGALIESCVFGCGSYDSANFSGAIISNSYFFDCDLANVNFSDAVLRDVKIHRSSFSETNLQGTDMEGVCFGYDKPAGGSTFDDRTKWPPSITTRWLATSCSRGNLVKVD